MQERKTTLTLLWKFVTKLEGGRGGGTLKFTCPRDCHCVKYYSVSYTCVRRHLCGVMDSCENKDAIGIGINGTKAKIHQNRGGFTKRTK